MRTLLSTSRRECDHVARERKRGRPGPVPVRVIGPYAGVADEAIKNGAVGSFTSRGSAAEQRPACSAEHLRGCRNPVQDARPRPSATPDRRLLHRQAPSVRARTAPGDRVREGQVRQAVPVIDRHPGSRSAITEDFGDPLSDGGRPRLQPHPVTVVGAGWQKAVVTRRCSCQRNHAWATTKGSLRYANTRSSVRVRASDMTSKATLTWQTPRKAARGLHGGKDP